jgi:hypothetical protein
MHVLREALLMADPKTVSTLPSFPEDTPAGADVLPENPVPRKGMKLQVWLSRIRALMFVTVCATFGVLLVILPWTHQWTDNSFLLTLPALRSFIGNGFVRGLATGLGMLDLWLGFWEAVHYHENPN